MQGWKRITPDYTPTNQGGVIEFEKAHIALLNALMTKQPIGKVVSPMFAEVKLGEPNNAQPQTKLWASDMNCTDPWVFPVQLKVTCLPNQGSKPVYMHSVERPSGKDGEIPMWDWLSLTMPKKYPPRSAVIRVT